jgi:tetratricopeptide (TPR) repeat protein
MRKVLYLILMMCLTFPLIATAKTAPVVRERILTQLQKSQKMIEAGEYSKSFELLNELSEAELTNHEHSQVYKLLAYQFFQSNEYSKAIPYYQKILQLEDLPQFTVDESLYSLSQLYFSVEDYVSAEKILSQWFEHNPDAGVQAYELQGQIYYQLKQKAQAIKSLTKAIELNQQNNKPPRQNWLQMLQGLYYESGDISSTIKTVEQLIHYYPKKVYWLQLAGLYGEQEQIDRQLYVMDAAYTEGLLNRESELKNLAYLYLDQQVPYQAAKILQKGLDEKLITPTEKNLQLLADAWRMAKEIKPSIEALELAAKKATHGNLYAQLAQLYLQDEQYKQAESAAKQAIEKGSLKQIGQLYNTLGIALFKQQRYASAKQAFTKAKQDPEAKKTALQWVKYVESFEGKS